MKQNKENTGNHTRIPKKNQIGGIHIGSCQVEMSSQKILMTGNLLETTGASPKSLEANWTFFEDLMENNTEILRKPQISAIFNCCHSSALLSKSTT